MRTYVTLAIFILFAIGSYWLLQSTSEEAISDKKSASRFPDYFMENFSITSLNMQGQPKSVLKANKMLHYADNDSAELEQPSLKVIRPKTGQGTGLNTDENNIITLRADRAVFFKHKNTLHLHDNVIIHRAATKTQSELSIYTDYLRIDTATNIAETDLATKVKTPEAEINSTGLIFDSLQGTLKLQSKVKGTYEATN